MGIFKAAIFVIAILGANAFEGHFKMEQFTRFWRFHVHGTVRNPLEFGTNNDFAFIDCIENSDNCTIFHEHINYNGEVHKRECPIQINDENQVNNPTLRSFNDDTVIISYSEVIKGNLVNIIHRSINMSTCNYHNTPIPFKDPKSGIVSLLSTMPRIVQYQNGSYDVFIYDEESCTGARCKYHVDENGKIDENPIPYLPKEYALKRIIMYPGIKGSYFAVVSNYPTEGDMDSPVSDHEIRLFYVTPNNNKEILHLNNEERLYDADNSNGVFGFCYNEKVNDSMFSNYVYCRQYDHDGSEILRRDDTFEFPLETLKMKNTNRGEYALLLDTLERTRKGKTKRAHYLFKHNKGYRHGDRIDDFDYNGISQNEWENYHVSNMLTNLLISKDEGTCVSILLQRRMSMSNLEKWQLVRKCLPWKYYDNEL